MTRHELISSIYLLATFDWADTNWVLHVRTPEYNKTANDKTRPSSHSA